MAIDPERIRRRMREAEESGRPAMGAHEARAALRVIAVVMDGEPHEQLHSGAAVLGQAS